MKVKIRTADFRFTLPVPVGMIGFIVRLIPDRVFAEMRAETPEAYRCLVTKDMLRMILGECQDILRQNKGLELIHVEAADGTFVSIKL